MKLSERESWSGAIAPGNNYFVTRNQSSVVRASCVPRDRCVCAHVPLAMPHPGAPGSAPPPRLRSRGELCPGKNMIVCESHQMWWCAVRVMTAAGRVLGRRPLRAGQRLQHRGRPHRQPVPEAEAGVHPHRRWVPHPWCRVLRRRTVAHVVRPRPQRCRPGCVQLGGAAANAVVVGSPVSPVLPMSPCVTGLVCH